MRLKRQINKRFYAYFPVFRIKPYEKQIVNITLTYNEQKNTGGIQEDESNGNCSQDR